MTKRKSILDELGELLDGAGLSISFDRHRDVTKGCGPHCAAWERSDSKTFCDNHLAAYGRGDYTIPKHLEGKATMPTLEEITLNPEQEALMVAMIEDVNSAPTPLKAVVRYQKWTKKIFMAGVDAAYEEVRGLSDPVLGDASSVLLNAFPLLKSGK